LPLSCFSIEPLLFSSPALNPLNSSFLKHY
jgi:hypothetical protein